MQYYPEETQKILFSTHLREETRKLSCYGNTQESVEELKATHKA